ncbi:di-trans,poly-cis-decaprenylcistransferase [Candidatus Parcubacteria bacterium]|jgi:undecaprenyl diphosphate synthase|nr:MAG: di-trans,poly-cis-decaprenylcistransferase [Candidatus Parcubacteria bacterium]
MLNTKQLAVPQHIGFIMDGNRRWAKERGLHTLEGHRRGYDNIKKVLQWCIDRGVKVVTVYAFSTENWNRPKNEVKYLMRLLAWAFKKELIDLQKKNVKVNFFGRLEGLPKNVQKELLVLLEKTKYNTKAVLNLAINYGGRAEILDAIKKLMKKSAEAFQLTELNFRNFLYNSSVPDPDLIIRTSGEQRLSGFLLWEAAYAELYFTKRKWPEFSEKDLDVAIEDFAQRKRNFGA